MSKSLVFKGLSFVKKGQGGKPPPVGIYVKERKGVVPSVAGRGSKKESRFKSKATLQDHKDSHGSCLQLHLLGFKVKLPFLHTKTDKPLQPSLQISKQKCVIGLSRMEFDIELFVEN